MSTYASRPAWSLKARAITTAWVTIPAGLGALVALSLLLRTTQLGIGFWIDEGLSVGIADRPLGDIPLALREDGSPPLYYMLLHFWLDVGGRSEAGVRGLSLLFALLAIPAAFWSGRVIWGTMKAAWFAAILMAFNPFLAQGERDVAQRAVRDPHRQALVDPEADAQLRRPQHQRERHQYAEPGRDRHPRAGDRARLEGPGRS